MRKHKRQIIATIILIVLMITGTATAQAVDIPQGNGYGKIHTYTVWDKIKWSGKCKELNKFAKTKELLSDSYGIVTIGDYFCGALTTTFGTVGDLMLVIEEDNIVYPVLMFDSKNQNNKGCNAYGHQGGKCMVEFEILSSCRKSLYGKSGGYISEVLAKPIVKIINLGSIYDNKYLNNPRQACIDNGLIGYTLLVNPYEGEIIKEPFESELSLNKSNYLFDFFWKNNNFILHA